MVYGGNFSLEFRHYLGVVASRSEFASAEYRSKKRDASHGVASG